MLLKRRFPSGWLALFLCLGLFVALGFGCVDLQYGGGDGTRGEPIKVPAEAPVPTAVLTSDFSPPIRLVLPTFTPTPAPTDTPVFGVADGAVGLGDDAGPVRTVVPPVSYFAKPFDWAEYARVRGVWRELGPGGLVSCVDVYRRMLVGYDGRVAFGPEVAEVLSDELLRARPDCAEAGWSPEFSLKALCIMPTLAGRWLPEAFRYHHGSTNRLHGTMATEHGSVLVHFSKAPLADGPACWAFFAGDGVWVSFTSGVGELLDAPRFPWCEADLRLRLAGTLGQLLEAYQVVELIELVRADVEGCETGGWDAFPRDSGYTSCGDRSTGWYPGGDLVVNWHPEHLAAGGAACWVYTASSDEWVGHTGETFQ